MLAKMGSFLYRRRISTLSVSLILVIGAAIYGLGVFDFLNGGNSVVDNSESSRATQLYLAKFGTTGTDVVLLLRSDPLRVTDASFAQAATALLSTLNKRTEVASIDSYYSTQNPDFISHDEHETFMLIRLKGQAQDFFTKQNEYTSLKPALSSQTLIVLTGGPIPATIAINQQANDDLQQAEIFTLPVLIVLLLLVFDGIIAALLPLLVGGVAILGAFAVLRGLTTLTDVSPYAVNVVTMLGLGVTIDYALFMLTRFREELNSNGQDARAALERTMATAGRTVIFSALTVSISLLSLLLFPLPYLRSLGLGAISAILVVMLVSLTILPVLLALLGQRVNALRLSRIIRPRRAPGASPGPTGAAPRGAANGEKQQGMWYRLSEMVMRWPIPVTLVVLIILLTLGIPFLHIKLATTDINVLPADQEARVVSQRLSQDFAHQGNAQLFIIIQTSGNALSPDNLASLDRYVKSIQALPGVVAVQSLVTVSPDLNLAAYQQLYAHPGLNPQITRAAATLANGNVSQMAVSLQPADHSSAATTLVKQIRALRVPTNLTALVDGTTPEEIDLLDGIETTLPAALLVIVASIFLLLFLMTGSLIVPLKAIILNMLSLSATFGGLVWIFQDGHFQNLLNFELLGSIDAAQPVLIFAIAFGLSMDYEVFVLSRVKEAFDETGDNRLAVSSGIQRTGWLVTSAALLLAVVLGGFAAATTISIQEIGIGLATAVIVDATLIRLLLLPATMRMLGTFNWWAPAPLRWLWQHIGLRETAPTPAFSPAFQVQAGGDQSGDPLWRMGLVPVRPQPPEVPIAIGHETRTSQQERSKQRSSPVLAPVGQAKAQGHEVDLASRPNVISTLIVGGEEVMGPEILLWRSPKNDLVNGSLLQVQSNQFCVVKVSGAILDVYEAGQYRVRTPDPPPLGLGQLTFNDEPLVPLECEALYINRAQLVIKTRGVARTREMAEVEYHVDYALRVATREDAVLLVEQMPYRGQTLSTKDLNAYAGPVIEQAVNQLVQFKPLLQVNNLKQDLEQLVQKPLQKFLSSYGITLDEVNVQVPPRDERIKARLSLKALDKSELNAVHHFTTLRNNSTNPHLKGQKEDLEQKLSLIRTTLDRYENEIAVIRAELESTCADFDEALDAHNARLQEFLRAASSDLRARALDSSEAPLGDVTPQHSTLREGYTNPDLYSLR